MKIEICEQMLQSWLQHHKQCEIVQTNWMVSPLRLRTISKTDIALLEKFMKDFQEQLNQDLAAEIKASLQESVDEDMVADGEVVQKKRSKAKKLNIFKKSNAHQFIRQCEIDVVGCKLDEGITERIYLVDTAFHKTGLGYHDAVATVVKKIVRAFVVAVLIFGESVPVTVAFASPKCGDSLKKEIETVLAGLRKILASDPRYGNIEIELYLNDRFTSDIYNPLLAEIKELNNDNDLFMRAMNLAKLAESSKAATGTPPTSGASGAGAATKTHRGENQQKVFSILKGMINNGKMTTLILNDLRKPDYAKINFGLPNRFPVLMKEVDFPFSGHDRCRYYKPTIKINGEDYMVCSQWVPDRIALLEDWYKKL